MDCKINIAAPALTSGVAKDVYYFATGGADKATGCTSGALTAGGFTVACKAEQAPHLSVYNANGALQYNSCVGDCTTQKNDACGNPVKDLLDGNLGPALIGSDGTIIVADDKRVYRFNTNGSTSSYPGWATCLPQAANGLDAYATVLTTDSSGNVNVTVMLANGPIETLQADTGNLVPTSTTQSNCPQAQSGDNYSFCPDPGSDGNGNFFYTRVNSACTVNDRIYATTIKYYPGISQPNNAWQDGRVYALQISHSGTAAVYPVGHYSFLSNTVPLGGTGGTMVGPSGASPMCAPDNTILTDFGTIGPNGLQTGCNGANTGCAGVLALYDCTSAVWNGSPPSKCNGITTSSPGYPFAGVYSVYTDSLLSGCSTNCGGDYIQANFPWDPGNSCFWAWLAGTDSSGNPYPVMSCMSTSSATVLKTMNISNLGQGLPGSPSNAQPISVVTMTSANTHAAALLGVKDVSAGVHGVLAIDTQAASATGCPSGSPANCTGSLYWYYQPHSPAEGQFAIATWSSGGYSEPLVWFTDSNYGIYAIGDCGRTGKPACH